MKGSFLAALSTKGVVAQVFLSVAMQAWDGHELQHAWNVPDFHLLSGNCMLVNGACAKCLCSLFGSSTDSV